MKFKNKKWPLVFRYGIFEIVLREVYEFKYLGVIFYLFLNGTGRSTGLALAPSVN